LSTPSGPQPGQSIDGVTGLLTAILMRDRQGVDSLNVSLCVESPEILAAPCEWSATLDGSGMAGIEQYDALHVRIWGVVRSDSATGQLVVDVTRYEKALSDERIQAWLGRMDIQTVDGREMVVLRASDGAIYVLSNYSPRPTAADEQIFWDEMARSLRNSPQGVLEGVLIPEARLGVYPVIRNLSWGDDPGRVDLQGYQLQPRPAVMDAPGALLSGAATIERVELIYMATIYGSSDPLQSIAQPMWRFTGRTTTGDLFQIWVQAVQPEYLK
jgi:hypothetical protein